MYNIILVCASIVLLCFYSVETALVCVCVCVWCELNRPRRRRRLWLRERRWMDGCARRYVSNVRRSRLLRSTSPTTKPVSFPRPRAFLCARVCVCVVVAVWSFFSCVCTVRLYNIIVVVAATALSPLTRTLSPPSVSFFFPPQLTPAPLPFARRFYRVRSYIIIIFLIRSRLTRIIYTYSSYLYNIKNNTSAQFHDETTVSRDEIYNII